MRKKNKQTTVLFLVLSCFFCCKQLLADTIFRDISITKTSDNFDQKILYPLIITNSMIKIKKINGFVFTITRKNSKKISDQPSFSETLFGIAHSSTGKCPIKYQYLNGYNDIKNKYAGSAIFTGIIKQIDYGIKIYKFDQSFQKEIDVNLLNNNCLFFGLDGTDFANAPYTMGAHIEITYEKISFPEEFKKNLHIGQLDGELLIDTNNKINPTLNGYIVTPVHSGGEIEPGSKLIDVFGNASVTSLIDKKTGAKRDGNWEILHKIMVYRKNSCQKSFNNHSPNKFTWNDRSGTSSKTNLSSAFWKDSILIGEIKFLGTGELSQEKSVSLFKSILPLKLEDGDCLVDAILPRGNMIERRTFNTESQIRYQIEYP